MGIREEPRHALNVVFGSVISHVVCENWRAARVDCTVMIRDAESSGVISQRGDLVADLHEVANVGRSTGDFM